MIRRSVPLFVLILVLVGCRSGAPPPACTDLLGCVTIPPDEPLKLGVIQTLSGGPVHQYITRLDDPAAGIEGVKANVIFEYRPKKTATPTDIDP